MVNDFEETFKYISIFKFEYKDFLNSFSDPGMFHVWYLLYKTMINMDKQLGLIYSYRLVNKPMNTPSQVACV